MSDVLTAAADCQPGARIRAFRKAPARDWSLDHLADLIGERGIKRPSAAKLSRIETGLQPVTLDILPAVSSITGIPPEELRPDVAEKFRTPEVAQ